MDSIAAWWKALDVPAFIELLAPELENERRRESGAHPRTHATMRCLSSVGAFLEKTTYREPGRIQAVFEHEHGAGRFISFFDESKERAERWTWWFKSLTTAPKSFVPVQMADLLAHARWRRTKQVWHSATPEKLRRSFEQMLGDGRVQLNAESREDCIKRVEQVRDILARYPDGLIP